MDRASRSIAIFGALVMLLVVAGCRSSSLPATATVATSASELERLLATHRLAEQKVLIRSLITRVGVAAAQDMLQQSGLPFTGQTHLLVHTVGEWIFENFSVEGLVYCRDHFLGACFHGFLVRAIGDHGPSVMGEAFERCRGAGIPTMVQCAHGAGHGLVAWTRYDLPEALRLCDELADALRDFHAFNCYDGGFMENAWRLHHGDASGTVHATSDPDYPCNDRRLAPRHLPACWGNQVAILFHLSHGDLRTVAARCEGLGDPMNQDACYNGLARQIHPLTGGESAEAFRLCRLLPAARQAECLVTLVESSFAVGDRRRMPFEICNRLGDKDGARDCYERLYASIRLHTIDEPEGAAAFCARVLDAFRRDECIQAQQTRSLSSAGSSPVDGEPPRQTQYPSPYLSPYQSPRPPYPSPYLSPYPSPRPYPSPYQTPQPPRPPYPDPFPRPGGPTFSPPAPPAYQSPPVYQTPYITPPGQGPRQNGPPIPGPRPGEGQPPPDLGPRRN